jgi:hypothetical protein
MCNYKTIYNPYEEEKVTFEVAFGITVYSVQGIVQFDKLIKIKNVSENHIIDINEFSEGVYFIKVQSGYRTIIKKFIIIR